MLPINYLPGTQRDFDEAFDWYASRSGIAAVRFTDAIDASLLRISQNARMIAFVDDIHQGCPVKRFPFRIIFRELEDQILIVAIAHAKRRPNYWRSRA
jgi:plasmid stabilization system protein ParE